MNTSARGFGHNSRLDGDRHSIPVAVRVHRGGGRARTLLVKLPPVLALGACELALGPPLPVLGAVREVLSRLGALHRGAYQRLLRAFSSFLCLVVVVTMQCRSTVVVWCGFVLSIL
jgi:hypothetical protein